MCHPPAAQVRAAWMNCMWELYLHLGTHCLEHVFEAGNQSIFVALSNTKERCSPHLIARWQKQVAKQCGHFCQVGMQASVTEPMGFEVANNSCLVGIKHCVGDNASRTSNADHKAVFQGACKGMSCTLSCYLLEIHQWGPSFNASQNSHVDNVIARPPLPAASPAEACKDKASGPRRLASVAFARELLQRRFALCYNHMVCKMIVKSLLAFPPQTSYFQLLTETQI